MFGGRSNLENIALAKPGANPLWLLGAFLPNLFLAEHWQRRDVAVGVFRSFTSIMTFMLGMESHGEPG